MTIASIDQASDPTKVGTVAVLGGGHGAVTAAGDLAARGFDVRLALRNRNRYAQLFETGKVTLEGAIESTSELEEVTDDHAAAMRGADLVLVVLPGNAQAEMAARIAPGVEEGQVICLITGTFGAFLVGRELERAGAPAVAIAEMATLPYGSRVSGEASARVALIAEYLPTGVYPASETESALERIRPVYPAVEPYEDALSAGLINFDGALHGPLVCMNAGAVEGLPSFDIHAEGASPAIVAVSIALDEERIALREALGYTTNHWPIRDYYEKKNTFYGNNAFREARAKSVWKEKIDFEHRYVREDIGCGLALWSSLGRLLDVSTPLSDALLALINPILGIDFREQGRTLENLGLGGLDAAQIKDWLRTGAEPGGRG
jgi:opine dehydrogenase